MTDSREKQSVAGTPRAIGLISGLKGFMVWTGGSLAGITAVLYVCGYLITTAHIYTLGLYCLVDFSKDYFLLEGSKFVRSEERTSELQPLMRISYAVFCLKKKNTQITE